LAQNTKGLAFGFTEKRQLAVKTDQNYVFLGRKVQILDMLHIMVMYISFYGFKYFFQFSAQNPNGLFFGINEKRLFVVKIDRKSLFLGRKIHILDWLHIMVLYISFYGLKKLTQNSKGSLRFYRKMQV
jgi:hypothetical protein